MHRHSKYWDKPDEFEPERFAREEYSIRPRYSYFPFGGGPRRCIGQSLAMIEAQLALVMIAQKYKLELKPKYKVIPQTLITLRPKHGMTMSITKNTIYFSFR
jgi:cytochrome P450